AHIAELFILQIDDAARQLAVGRIPEGVDAQRLYVDAVGVHDLEALRSDGDALEVDRLLDAPFEAGAANQVRDFGHHAMRLHVDGLDAVAAHRDLPSPGRLCGRVPRGVGEAGGPDRRGGGSQETAAAMHARVPPLRP